jgi:hypothetical protein
MRTPLWTTHPKPPEQPVSRIEPLPAPSAVSTVTQFTALPPLPANVAVVAS